MKQVELVDIMYALSDPTRVEMVRQLARSNKPMTCGELMLGRPKSSMSHHFKTLRGAGIIQTVIEGTEHMNSLRLDEIEVKFPNVLNAIIANIVR